MLRIAFLTSGRGQFEIDINFCGRDFNAKDYATVLQYQGVEINHSLSGQNEAQWLLVVYHASLAKFA